MEVKINKAKELHNDKYDYSKVNFKKMIDKVIIICPEHGEFQQTMHKHLQGDGCRKCGTIKHSQSKVNKSKESFEIKARNIHNDLYDYSLVDYKNARCNVKIICKVHGQFEITPNRHLSGSGCQKCGRLLLSKSLTYPLDKYLDEVNKKYNYKYDYSKIKWEGVDKNITIICPSHNLEFITNGRSHRDLGVECRICKKEKTINYNQLTTEIFIKKAKEIWGDKYDYSKTNYINANNKVIIICKIHGEFLQYPSNHYKYDCLKCSKYLVNLPKINLARETFVDKANKIHNNKYNYDKFNYINSTTKIIVTCLEHGDFEIRPYKHLQGQGCYHCKYKNFSNISIQWLRYCEIKYNCKIQDATNLGEFKIPSTNYRADGYCKEKNLIFEFYGDFYHGNPELFDPSDINPVNLKSYEELYINTIERENKIKSLGYNLISIWENDWEKFVLVIKKIKKLYKKKLNNKNK